MSGPPGCYAGHQCPESCYNMANIASLTTIATCLLVFSFQQHLCFAVTWALSLLWPRSFWLCILTISSLSLSLWYTDWFCPLLRVYSHSPTCCYTFLDASVTSLSVCTKVKERHVKITLFHVHSFRTAQRGRIKALQRLNEVTVCRELPEVLGCSYGGI